MKLHRPMRCPNRATGLLTLALAALVTGCSGLPSASSPKAEATPLTAASDCPTRIAHYRQRIESAAIEDPYGYAIDGYPYLRVDRTLASFVQPENAAGEPLDRLLNQQHAFNSWYQRLYTLAKQARQFELANLHPPYPADAVSRLEGCIEQQASSDRQADNFHQQLLEQTQVPELYSSGQRALGLFPLTREIVLQQIGKEQQRWHDQFNNPTLFHGSNRRYAPPDSSPLDVSQIGEWLEQAQRNDPLQLPQLNTQRLQRLFRHFAPVWQISTPIAPSTIDPKITNYIRPDSDLIGSLYWPDGRPDTLPALNSSDPTSYLMPSYTRIDGRWLLQLNYLVWFNARPPQQSLDLYAGALDGLLWRVTLDSDGTVLLYDSIHPCGCYHQIFPVSARLEPKPADVNVEQPLIIKAVAFERSQGRTVLQLTGQEHFLQGIALQPQRTQIERDRIEGTKSKGDIRNNPAPINTPYRLASYHQLRSLPAGAGRRGLFARDGLVTGTERPERWLLWPMGVDSPGAMRIWGRHAISFANRRYFDQPDLFEPFFEFREQRY
ncbi:MAG: hypothetical protein V7707_17355 [Motiliproteus sp.]